MWAVGPGATNFWGGENGSAGEEMTVVREGFQDGVGFSPHLGQRIRGSPGRSKQQEQE